MKVLIAVDQPDFARAIAEYVVQRDWPAATEFVILSIVESPKVGNVLAVLPGPVLDDIENDRFESAETLVQNTAHLINQARLECSIEKVVTPGFPKEDIVNYAIKNDIDLIIVGSHSKTGLSRLLLGSVSMAVLTHSVCPVVVIKLPHEEKLDKASAALVAAESA
jgi:universal stress protein A